MFDNFILLPADETDGGSCVLLSFYLYADEWKLTLNWLNLSSFELEIAAELLL